MKNLKPFRVSVREDRGDKFALAFYCLADDPDHAEEQALDAYPNGEVVHVVECSREEYPYAIHEE